MWRSEVKRVRSGFVGKQGRRSQILRCPSLFTFLYVDGAIDEDHFGIWVAGRTKGPVRPEQPVCDSQALIGRGINDFHQPGDRPVWFWTSAILARRILVQ